MKSMQKYLITAKYFLALLLWQVKWHLSQKGLMNMYIHVRGRWETEFNHSIWCAMRIYAIAQEAEMLSLKKADSFVARLRKDIQEEFSWCSLERDARGFALMSIFNLANQRRASIAFADA